MSMEIAKRGRTGDCVKNEGEECVCEYELCGKKDMRRSKDPSVSESEVDMFKGSMTTLGSPYFGVSTNRVCI
jgi:hypothetical protein